MVIFLVIVLYYQERGSKLNFLQQKKIERLIQEQIKLFDLLPDGLVIHSKVEKNEAEGTTEVAISYLNKMFQRMFKDLNASVNQGFQAFTNFNKIYLKEAGYKIVDQVMQQIDVTSLTPIPLRKSLDEFETGYVYEVVY